MTIIERNLLKWCDSWVIIPKWLVAGDIVEDAIGRKKEPEEANEYDRMDWQGRYSNKHTASVSTCTRKQDNTRQDFTRGRTGIQRGSHGEPESSSSVVQVPRRRCEVTEGRRLTGSEGEYGWLLLYWKKRLDVLFSIISQRIKWEWERRTWKLGWGLWAYDKWVDTKVICDERKGHKSPLARDKENDSLCRKQDLSSSPWGNRGFCLDAWPWEKDFLE